VIDADGLNALAKKPEVMKNVKAPIVVTPHPGEMARLSGTTTKDIQNDRVTHARKFAAEFGVIVVLKGARTIIADPHDHIYINTTGNPGMASGGMGDVLTGMITGLISQGISPLQASTLSVFVHGLIGDAIERDRAGIGIMATDIIDRIPGTLQQFME
jgi:NAD(P)H-hydrate epimerase